MVTGTHLESSFGYTADEIRKDGFTVEKEFPLNIKTNTTSDILCSMSVALRDFGAYFEKNKFDLVIVLGDRYEIMAAAIAAAMQKIPLLHLHGCRNSCSDAENTAPSSARRRDHPRKLR